MCVVTRLLIWLYWTSQTGLQVNKQNLWLPVRPARIKIKHDAPCFGEKTEEIATKLCVCLGRWSSKEVWKLNFRQYGQMEKHSQEEAQTWRKSEGRSKEMEKIRRGESQKREDAGARKGRKVAKHYVCPLFCGSGGSKSRLAKATHISESKVSKPEGF